MGFIVDTCIWIDVERGTLSPSDVEVYTGANPVYISPITLAELAFGTEMASSEALRNRRLSALNRLRKKPILQIDEETGLLFGRVAASLRKSGRDPLHRIQDLWLASQAIQHDFSLLTKNGKDFRDIPGLSLVEIPATR